MKKRHLALRSAATFTALRAVVFLALPILSVPPVWGGTEAFLEPVAPVAERTITLAPVRSTELFDGPSELEVSISGGELLGPDVSTRVVRRLTEFWRMKVLEDTRIEDFVVSYELVSEGGQRDRLNHRDNTDQEIPVRVRPIPPELLPSAFHGYELRGGVVLELDVTTARSAGNYVGTLTVTFLNL